MSGRATEVPDADAESSPSDARRDGVGAGSRSGSRSRQTRGGNAPDGVSAHHCLRVMYVVGGSVTSSVYVSRVSSGAELDPSSARSSHAHRTSDPYTRG